MLTEVELIEFGDRLFGLFLVWWVWGFFSVRGVLFFVVVGWLVLFFPSLSSFVFCLSSEEIFFFIRRLL